MPFQTFLSPPFPSPSLKSLPSESSPLPIEFIPHLALNLFVHPFSLFLPSSLPSLTCLATRVMMSLASASLGLPFKTSMASTLYVLILLSCGKCPLSSCLVLVLAAFLFRGTVQGLARLAGALGEIPVVYVYVGKRRCVRMYMWVGGCMERRVDVRFVLSIPGT